MSYQRHGYAHDDGRNRVSTPSIPSLPSPPPESYLPPFDPRQLQRTSNTFADTINLRLTANIWPPNQDDLQSDDRTGQVLSRERIVALSEVDGAKFSFFHFKVCAIAGVGFFADAYDIFAIGIASVMIDFIYNNDPNHRVSKAVLNAVKAAAPVGTFIGQIIFGRLADVTGRKRMYGFELIIIIIGTFGQALSANGSVKTLSIYTALIVWRFVMGLGIGGDYPLSAVITAEFASSHIRGKMMTTVFAFQGIGQFVAALFALLIVVGFKNSFGDLSTPSSDDKLIETMDKAWRILLGLGCLPALLALYFRLTIPESPRFTMDVERNVKGATKDIDNFVSTGKYKYNEDPVVVRVAAPRASWRDFAKYFSKWRNLRVLLGCAYAWFAVDVAFYGVGLNTDSLFCEIGLNLTAIACNMPVLANSTAVLASSSIVNLSQAANLTPLNITITTSAGHVFRDLIDLCWLNLIFSGVGLIPGYVATWLVIEKWGRKIIQMMGFAVLTVLFTIMGVIYLTVIKPTQIALPVGTDEPDKLSVFHTSSGTKALFALLCLAGFFLNFGPNSTTFIIPASGKLGAIISQFAIAGRLSTGTTLLVFIPFMFTGLLATLFIGETNQKTLEDLSNERQDNFITGIAMQDLNRKLDDED